ncbi:MAG: cell division protein FtsZ [Bacteroidota bacterium]
MFDDLVTFNMPLREDSIITIIGVGGGGCNAVNRMYREGIRDVDFLVVNTDSQALQASPVEKKIQLGATLTEGRGAGNRSDVGEQAAIENINEISDLLQPNTRMAFIVAGMGKGTGTGAAPVIARACKELNILTVGVVTLPFTIEGPSRQHQALQGVKRLKEEVDALLIIHNEKLREIYGGLSLGEAFKKADDILTLAVKGIAEIITVHGYINVDFADVQSVMINGGIAFMGSATARGFDRARNVIDETINSPLLNSNDIRGASRVLLNITSGREEITVDEVGCITDIIMERVGGMVNVIWGTCSDESLADEIRITLIATGFRDESIPDWISLNPPRRESVSMDPAYHAPEKIWEKVPEPAPKRIAEPEPVRESFIQSPPPEPVQEPVPDPEVDMTVIHKEPVADSIDFTRPEPRNPEEDKMKTERLRQFNYHSLSNPDLIDEAERVPAYKRRKLPVQQDMFLEQQTESRYTIGADAKLRANNSYLFDAVD